MRHRNGRLRRVVETVPADYEGNGTMYPGDKYEVWYVQCSCGQMGSGVTPGTARSNGCYDAWMAFMRAGQKRRRRPSAMDVAARSCGMVKVRVDGRTWYE